MDGCPSLVKKSMEKMGFDSVITNKQSPKSLSSSLTLSKALGCTLVLVYFGILSSYYDL